MVSYNISHHRDCLLTLNAARNDINNKSDAAPVVKYAICLLVFKCVLFLTRKQYRKVLPIRPGLDPK